MRGSVIIEIPGPPRGKGRPRFTTNGRAYTDAKTRAYERELAMHAKAAMRGRAPMEGPLHLTVVAKFPVPKSWSLVKKRRAQQGYIFPIVKPDADNLLKVVDAFNGIVWKDDAQVVEVAFSKDYAEIDPYMRFFVDAIEDDTPDTPADLGRTGN